MTQTYDSCLPLPLHVAFYTIFVKFREMTSTINGWSPKQKHQHPKQQKLQHLYLQKTELELVYVTILRQCNTILQKCVKQP